MNLLGLETATSAAGVALSRNQAEITELIATTERRHTETLFDAVRSLLAEEHLAVADLDGIVVDIGPGLFTGLRVGVTAARSLAAAAGKELFVVTSLEVLASDRATPEEGSVVAIVDARRGEVFVECFAGTRLHRQSLGSPEIRRPEELSALLDGLPGDVTVVGDGALRYADALGSRARSGIVDAVSFPSPAVALEMVIAQERGPTALEEVLPLYLRDPDAVANFSVARGRGSS